MPDDEKKTKARTVRWGETTDRKIKELAKEERRRPSEVARNLIESALAQKPPPK